MKTYTISEIQKWKILLIPITFNNKSIDVDFVSDTLRQYQIIKEPKNIVLYQTAFVHKRLALTNDVNYVEKPEGAFGIIRTDYERLE